LKSALVHLATRQTPEATLEAALGWLEQAHAQGADLALLPELFPSGYRYADAPKTPWVLAQLQDFARRSGVTIACGVLEQAGERHANRLRVLAPEGERAVYTKLHLIPAFDEPHTMIPGEKPVALELGGFTAGLSICFDLRFPELYRGYAVQGADLFLVPSAWPAERAAAWELLTRARAAENQAYLLAVNHAEPPFGAPSLAVGPLGEVLGRLEREGLLVVELDPTLPKRLRQQFPVLSERRRDLYGDLFAQPVSK
jgi:predicted amidohydrolase